MTTQSNFERDIASREERRQLAKDKKHKQADYYHAISKISYTALVAGIIVTAVQNFEKIGFQYIVALAFGLVVTISTYLYGNNKLK